MSAGPPGISDKRWSLSTSLSSVGKEFSCNAGDPGLISGLGRSAGEGIAYSSIFWASLIQKTKIMASGPITSWEIDGKIVETVSDFIFLSSKITADGDCSHEIKRRLLLGRKVMTNLDSILKSRDIT